MVQTPTLFFLCFIVNADEGRTIGTDITTMGEKCSNNSCGCGKGDPAGNGGITLKSLVENYLHDIEEKKGMTRKKVLEVYLEEEVEDLTSFICGLHNDEKVEKGTKYKLHPHQWRALNGRPHAVNEAGRKLKNTDEVEFRNFEELMDYVDHPDRKVKYFGDTCKYDFALRHGWHRNPRIEPEEYVYVHSKPLQAAKALKEKGYLKKVERRMRFDSLPEELRLEGMTAKDVENFLCIYKEQIEQLPSKE